ncbi:MAG: hypothetical protein HN411_04620 [Waddliaceae bacterium]|jgi:hypothetical protein|nr:hypothetical protein [Waddliaceae bacterium]MBT3579296.1 hypothetical protein [Waddliaceae bacterium]MBT4444724.1 hypothetical protein [Waddliaceae bacterium]MBT6928435.1 hypothetical protein [Waddliaceae bacterium]MBT7264081.1 hypothetical protein [Waddliaceae bacterium]
MIKLEEKNDLKPICPHCEAEIETLWYKIISGFLGKRYLYFCSECKKTLGVSHRKGFWQG